MSRASAYTDGYQRVFLISAGVTVVAFLVSFALPRGTGRSMAASVAPPAEVDTPFPFETA